MTTELWMSEATDADIGNAYALARREMEPVLNEAIGTLGYGSMTRWAFIGLVLRPPHAGFDEVRKYRKKTQEFEFSLRIDHAAFKAADAIGHRKLIMGSLLRCIDEMRKLVPKGIDYDQLEHDVRQVAESKGWLPDAKEIAAPPPPPATPAEVPALGRIYKNIDGTLHYESAFVYEGIAYHHSGKVGTRGKTQKLPIADKSPQQAVDAVFAEAMAKGFVNLGENHQIEIQYKIDDFGTVADVDKLHALEAHLHDLLGALGMGTCSDNSIGSGTMEVSCYVVDADIAMKCIKKSLKGTQFGDYATIHVVPSDDEDDDV